MVEGRKILHYHRQIKISCLLEFPVSVLFYVNTWWYHVFFSLFQALVSWNMLKFITIDTDRLKYDSSIRGYSAVIWHNKKICFN